MTIRSSLIRWSLLFAAVAMLAWAILGSAAPAGFTGLVFARNDECPYCRKMQPIIDKLIEEGQPIMVRTIAWKDVRREYGDDRLPLTLAYHAGQGEVDRRVGQIGESELRELLQKVKGE